MMFILLHLVVLTLTVLLLARALPGFRIRAPSTAVVVAIVFSLLNWSMGWLIKVMLFLPAILTLGLLFLILPLIVNLIVLWLTDKVLHAFEIADGRTLWLAAGAITLVNFFFHLAVRAHLAHSFHPNAVLHV
jgi:putative membrane protein